MWLERGQTDRRHCGMLQPNNTPGLSYTKVKLKLLIDNPEEKFVPGMTAEVYVPKAKLVKQ